MMPEREVRRFDLNLLVALDALLEERNVSKAAARLGLSQPAMSRALGRLRKSFGDQLLVRGQNGYVPTSRAEDLIAPVRRVLQESRALLEPGAFNPKTARAQFRIITNDHCGFVLLPNLVGAIRVQAPGIDLEVARLNGESLEQLASGEADLLVGRPPAMARAGHLVQLLLEEPYVCVLRDDHPALKGKLTLKDYCAYPHCASDAGGLLSGDIDAALTALDQKRRIALRTPDFIAALFIVAGSDLIHTVPRSLAERLAPATGLAIADLPFKIAPAPIGQIWHERHQTDPAHAWLRAQVKQNALGAVPRRTNGR
jgi:LysR family transcriptional regulator, transcriptional activator of nodD3 and syrA